MKRAIFVMMMILLAVSMSLSRETAGSDTDLSVEAELCTGIEERMPLGVSDRFDPDVGRVYLWTRITGAGGGTMIKHVWYYGDEEKASIELPVKSVAWRTWSYKTVLPELTGDWKVDVVDAAGDILQSAAFSIGE